MIRLDIINDGTGTTETGHYDVYLYLPGEGEVAARVEDFDRSRGWEPLASKAVLALDRALQERKGEH